MSLRAVLCAAALVFAPVVAGAATLNPSNDITDNGLGDGADNSYIIQGGPFHWEATVTAPGDVSAFHYYEFKFTSNASQVTAGALSTVLQTTGGFNDLVVGWVNGDQNWYQKKLGSNFSGTHILHSSFVPGVTDTLAVVWSGMDAGLLGQQNGSANLKLTIAAVPVPMGAFLLGTGLLGFGLLRRRRRPA